MTVNQIHPYQCDLTALQYGCYRVPLVATFVSYQSTFNNVKNKTLFTTVSTSSASLNTVESHCLLYIATVIISSRTLLDVIGKCFANEIVQ